MNHDDINHCPKCRSPIEVLGVDVEDRRVADCPECGLIEVVYHDISADRDGEWLERVTSKR